MWGSFPPAVPQIRSLQPNVLSQVSTDMKAQEIWRAAAHFCNVSYLNPLFFLERHLTKPKCSDFKPLILAVLLLFSFKGLVLACTSGNRKKVVQMSLSVDLLLNLTSSHPEWAFAFSNIEAIYCVWGLNNKIKQNKMNKKKGWIGLIGFWYPAPEIDA